MCLQYDGKSLLLSYGSVSGSNLLYVAYMLDFLQLHDVHVSLSREDPLHMSPAAIRISRPGISGPLGPPLRCHVHDRADH